MLTLASLAKTAKRYALDSSTSDEAFLNALLEPLVIAGRVRARGGKEFSLDKSRTSLVINGKCDVPNSLRKALVRFGLEDTVTHEFGSFVEDCIDLSLFEPFANEVIELASGSGETKLRMAAALDNPERFMAIALLEAVKNENRESTAQSIWDSGTGSLCIEVGDLLAHGFGKPRKMKQIVVVPVDTTFATEITWGYESSPAPKVSPKTLHGQWLVRMEATGVEPDELVDRIGSSLRRRSVAPVQEGGVEYPIGSVAIVPNARSVFYLTAIARLDKNNNARATREDILSALRALLETYDKEGQGLDIFIPLIGTGESRAGLTHQESLDLIVNTVTTNRTLVHGKVTIVVYRGDANKLEITAKEN
ncbi:MAG: DUF6430 domain-containing protein [Coriobacteriia bacterium]|nr:DUF6430 domain-containing protein [Coriobacteriia bacterium]